MPHDLGDFHRQGVGGVAALMLSLGGLIGRVAFGHKYFGFFGVVAARPFIHDCTEPFTQGFVCFLLGAERRIWEEIVKGQLVVARKLIGKFIQFFFFSLKNSSTR